MEDTLPSTGALNLTILEWVLVGEPHLPATHTCTLLPPDSLLEPNSPHPTFKFPFCTLGMASAVIPNGPKDVGLAVLGNILVSRAGWGRLEAPGSAVRAVILSYIVSQGRSTEPG